MTLKGEAEAEEVFFGEVWSLEYSKLFRESTFGTQAYALLAER